MEKSLQLMRTATRVFKEALPETDPELIGGFFADLLDLWETGQKLDKELLKLQELRLPEDRERLRDILIWISAIQVDMASYWIDQIRKDLPKLMRELDKLEGKPKLSKRKQASAKKQSVGRPDLNRRSSIVSKAAI